MTPLPLEYTIPEKKQHCWASQQWHPAYRLDGHWQQVQRLSRHAPLFVSPHGTGCSRYVDVLQISDHWYITWQQSRPDLSQRLLMNVVCRREIEELPRAWTAVTVRRHVFFGHSLYK